MAGHIFAKKTDRGHDHGKVQGAEKVTVFHVTKRIANDCRYIAGTIRPIQQTLNAFITGERRE